MRYMIGCLILLGSIAFSLLMRIQQASAQDLVQDNFLVVASAHGDIGNLYQIDLRSSAMTPLLRTTSFRPVTVAFDSVERVVYWTDVQQRLIGKAKLGESQRNFLIIFRLNGTSKLSGLALDTENRQLYCADQGSSKIYEMHLDGTRPISIVSETGMQPEALVVDTKDRDLYYTDRGVHPGIYVYNLHMWQRRKILTENMVWPNALAIDFGERVMYWTDAKFNRIEMANLDGSGRVTLITETNAHYFAMALSPEYLYITDSNKTSINRLDRKTHTMAEKLPKVFGKDGLYGIVFYNSSFAGDTTTKPVDDKTLGPDRHNSAFQINHTMVIIVAVTVAGVISITGIIALSVCYVAKRRRAVPDAVLHYMTNREHIMANTNAVTNGQRFPDDNECFLTFDTNPILPESEEERYSNLPTK